VSSNDAPRVRVDGAPDAAAAVRAIPPDPFSIVDGDADCRVRAVDSDAPADDLADVDVIVASPDAQSSLFGQAAAAGAVSLSLGDERFRRHLVEAISRAVDARSARRRAEQFDAVFADPDTLVAVLDASGRLRRTNTTFDDVGAADGQAFWDVPWWTDPDAVRKRTERAVAGDRVAFETTCTVGGDERNVSVSLRPVTVDGAVRSVVVEGRDVTERVRLASDLRASEELHRVTLNNMTDTVLITDDDGEYTYVCPNVHFIFEYTADEIHELGTIDELLGEDLYDPAALDETDALTNIECTAVDKDGEEHTLLVNVRRVDIQGGTTLVSCRDITKRKERERALAHLHRTARDLLYAETDDDIAEQVVADGLDVLSVPATAVYGLDAETSVLSPAAQSDGFVDHFGAARDRQLTDDPVGEAFVDGTSRTLTGDVVPDGLGSVLVVPLGDHGVFVAGMPGPDVDEVTLEFADLLSATAEAALDRVARESDLRARDRTLKQRNRQLTRLNRANDLIRESDQSLLHAETREAVEHYGGSVDGATVAVQGFGSVGASAARLLDEWGASVVAVSDATGGVYDPDGLDTGSIPSHDEEPEAVARIEGASVSNADLLELDVDVLVPAAVGNVVTADNADDVRADIVVEGANGPTTVEADAILDERGVAVIPDILANAGGVTVSYFEWLQDINRRSWSLERVNDELESAVLAAWDDVRSTVRTHDLTWRDAAYVVALSRIAEAKATRGLWP
jgi:PAS domain S-box-containing protein